MARRRKKGVRLSADEARNALAFLVHEGRIGVREVEKALERRERVVREIKARLSALGELATKGGPFPMVAGAARRMTRRGAKRSRRAVSAATRKARQAQGRYMAAVRRLSKEARTRVKAIREKSGVNAAIKAAKRMTK